MGPLLGRRFALTLTLYAVVALVGRGRCLDVAEDALQLLPGVSFGGALETLREMAQRVIVATSGLGLEVHTHGHRRQLGYRDPTEEEKVAWALLRRSLALEVDELLFTTTPLVMRRMLDGMQEDSPEPTGGRAHVGVCITGYLNNVELESKIRHIVGPMARSYDVDLVLILGDPEPDLNTTYSSAQATVTRADVMNRTATLVRAARGDVKGTKGVTMHVETPRYPSMELLHHSLSFDGVSDDQSKLLLTRDLVREWRSLWRCFRRFVHLEARTKKPYHTFVKASANLAMLTDMRMPLNRGIVRQSAIFANCSRGSHAMLPTDLTILDAKYAYPYFAVPVIDWYFNFSEVSSMKSFTPFAGSYFPSLMARYNVTMRREASEMLYAVPVRQHSNGSQCVELTMESLGRKATCIPKDCHVRLRILCSRCPDMPLNEPHIHGNVQSLVKSCMPRFLRMTDMTSEALCRYVLAQPFDVTPSASRPGGVKRSSAMLSPLGQARSARGALL